MIVALDVDGIVLDLLPTWISLYNQEFDQNLDWKTIDDWDTSKFVIPEAKKRIFEYIEYPDVFYGSKPIKGALEAVKYIKSYGHRIIYVTANNPGGSKEIWLKEHGFLDSNKDFVQAYDKSLIFADILFDDRYENCRDFKGWACLYNMPYNLKFDYSIRANNWEEFVNKII